MSKNFGTLNAKITANTEDFKANLNKASKEAEGFKQKVTNQLNSIKPSIDGLSGSLAGMFAGLSVAGIVTGFMNITNSIDRLNDVADATGASIEGISRLENIAIATGGSIADVESALSKLVTKLNDVDDESNVSRALKAIGLNAEELRSMDPSQALNKVAIALSQYENDANKAQLGTALLGKSYKELAPFLNDIAENQHIVATVTGQMAEEADRLNKIINRQKLIFDAYSRDLAGNVLPVISDIATAFLNSGNSAEAAGNQFQFLTNLIKIAAVAGNELAYVFDITGKEIGVVMAQLTALSDGKGIAGPTGMRAAWNEEQARLTKEKDKRNAAITAAGTGQPNTANTPTPPKAPNKKTAPDFRLTTPTKKTGDGSKSSKEDPAIKLYATAQDDFNKIVLESILVTDDLTKSQKKLQELQSTEKWAQLTQSQKDALVIRVDSISAIEKQKQAQKELDDILSKTPTGKLIEQQKEIDKINSLFESGKVSLKQRNELLSEADPLLKKINDLLKETPTSKLKEQKLVTDEINSAYRQGNITLKERNELLSQVDPYQQNAKSLYKNTKSGQKEENSKQKQGVIDAYNNGVFGDVGSVEALQKYKETLKQVDDEAQKLNGTFIDISSAVDNAAESMAQSFIDFTTGAQTSFSKMAQSILADLAKMIVRQQIFNALQMGMKAISAAFAPTAAAPTGAWDGATAFSASSGGYWANGGAFQNGAVIPFANGDIFDSPIKFPMAGGKTGVMGEAGPEAIMPLTRINGKLGVHAVGGGSNQVINQVNVTVQGGSNPDETGSKVADAVMRAIAQSEISKATRYGGILNRG